MKRLFSLSVLLFLIAVQVVLGQIPQTMSYQGILTDASGEAVENGDYDLTFKLYDSVTGGTELWSESQSVSVNDGLFNVILGSVNPLNIPFDNTYWLGITVGEGPELTPRIELTSSAYSLNTRSIADSAVTGEKITNGQVVRSINSLTDDVTIKAGENVTVIPSGDTLTISATGGGADGDWIISGENMYSGVSGNIGIGTTNPQRQFHIARSDYVSLVLEDKGADIDQKKKFINTDDGYLNIGKFTDSWTFTPQMTIDNDGNGGSVVCNSDNQLHGTIGQPAIGVTQDASHINQVGFWYQAGDFITHVDRNPEVLPEKFRLEQNYPNPFNPITTIRFAVPRPCRVPRTFKVRGTSNG